MDHRLTLSRLEGKLQGLGERLRWRESWAIGFELVHLEPFTKGGAKGGMGGAGVNEQSGKCFLRTGGAKEQKTPEPV